MNIPEGYRLVPIIPTEEMIGAGQDQEWTEDVYAAMISAAPNTDLKDSDEAKVFNDLMWAAKEMLRIAGIANQGSSAYNRAIINLHEVVVSCVKSRARSAE